MKDTLITKNIWEQITTTCKATNRRSYVAVAYLGNGGANRLPLSKDSCIVVDASETTVKLGLTCPDELLKLYDNGVKIYSQPLLHAKVYVIGTKAFVGSANVSSNSELRLKEAMLMTSNRNMVQQAKGYVTSFCNYELGREEIIRLGKVYKPPKTPGNILIPKDNRAERCYIYGVEYFDETEEYAKAYVTDKDNAVANMQNADRHILDDIDWEGKLTVKPGDMLVQVLYKNGKEYVYPPARVLRINRYKRGYAVVYLELPNKRRKNLSKLPGLFKHELAKDKWCSASFTTRLQNLWK